VTAADQAEVAARARAFKPEQILSEPLTEAGKQIVMARRFELDDPKRARASLLRALELEPKNERALRMLASRALIDENHEEAREMAGRCIAVNPSNAWCSQVLEYAPRHVAADLKAPLERVHDCLEKEQDNLLCLAAKADLSFTTGNRADASAAVERLVALKTSLPGVRDLEARLEAWSGNYAEARALFDTACAYRSQQSCFRAEVLRSQGF
jgi:Tfp pilus assembly protein PilF